MSEQTTVVTTNSTSNGTTAAVRTLVPIVAGTIATWLLKRGVDIDSTVVSGVVQAVLTYLYWLVVTVLERVKSSKWGWLLGVAKVPVYPVDPPLPPP